MIGLMCGTPLSSHQPLKVAVEEPARGFTQSDDIVVSVFIPYCEAGAEWEIIINSDKPETCPDLVPLPATEAEVGKVGQGANRIATAFYFFFFCPPMVVVVVAVVVVVMVSSVGVGVGGDCCGWQRRQLLIFLACPGDRYRVTFIR